MVSSQSMMDEALGSAQAPRAIVVFCDKLAKTQRLQADPRGSAIWIHFIKHWCRRWECLSHAVCKERLNTLQSMQVSTPHLLKENPGLLLYFLCLISTPPSSLVPQKTKATWDAKGRTLSRLRRSSIGMGNKWADVRMRTSLSYNSWDTKVKVYVAEQEKVGGLRGPTYGFGNLFFFRRVLKALHLSRQKHMKCECFPAWPSYFSWNDKTGIYCLLLLLTRWLVRAPGGADCGYQSSRLGCWGTGCTHRPHGMKQSWHFCPASYRELFLLYPLFLVPHSLVFTLKSSCWVLSAAVCAW